ncbi:MAG: glucuronate isomerase [Clostridia bacterium]|nr:glucuronate isomerase [Clostridia bacterium]
MTEKRFFDQNLLVGSRAARELYGDVKDLPIIDYHCHLDPRMIADNARFEDIGAFWLAGDHYKWRAMRLCGVDEKYITGDASFHDKFLKYAEIVPKLCGNPLYYWTHMELSQIFGITKPLCGDTAELIYAEASAKLADMSVWGLLEKFGVEYIATTDDPIDDLGCHGKYGKTTVAPTFRPDKVWSLDESYLKKLGEAACCDTSTLDGLLAALTKRLDYFVAHGCRISDHGFEQFPAVIATKEQAEVLYSNREKLADSERQALFGFLLTALMREYKKRGMTVQLHFGVTRNVNPAAFANIGVDSGFDVMSTPPDPKALISFLASIPDAERPDILLYTLNDSALPSLACVTGAFRGVRMGAAWWFNDTMLGIRRNLETIAEYSVLGTSVGMLTDSRSFSSYARFDFFRRILADVVGGYVERGEYDSAAACGLMRDICYNNAKELIKL